jgi:hypothetical protein
VEHHSEDPGAPGLDEVIDKVIAATWKADLPAALAGEVHRAVDSVALYHLMALAANDNASVQARAIAFERLGALAEWLNTNPQPDATRKAHFVFGAAQIKRFLANPKEIPVPKPVEAPPGQPIGCDWN